MTEAETPFDRIVDSIDYPMFVVTAAAQGEVGGCLVGFTSQCSIDPARFAVFLSKSNNTFEIAARASVLVVHRIAAGQLAIAEHFGGSSAKEEPGKLASCEWVPGPDGAPVIAGCDWFAGEILERLDTGDHVCHVVEPFGGSFTEPRDQLGFQNARDIEPGQPA
jgi:flavin reductase (DIM6/NTAB) family NADH-FMN oxidoreductase RutF